MASQSYRSVPWDLKSAHCSGWYWWRHHSSV